MTTRSKPRASPPNYGLEVRYTLRSFTQALTGIAASVDLTASEFRVLRTLGESQGNTHAELATLAAMDRPYVSTLVKKMTARGLLTSRVDALDRRRVSIALTPAGRRVLDQMARELDQTNRLAVAGIPAADLRIFLSVLQRLRANLDSDGVSG